MNYDLNTTTSRYKEEAVSNTLIRNVYIWMCIALMITGGTASFIASTPSIAEVIFSNRIFFYGLLIAQLGIVWIMSSRVNSLSLNALSALFVVYALLTGLTFSLIFLIYTTASIASTFFVTAGTFGVMSIYGYLTNRDLTKLGNLCMMALIGLILATVVNIFLANETLYWITTYVGVLIFTGLIAYDTQKLKALSTMENSEHTQKLAITGALSLYLDFINLFLMLLRILGKRR